jgi:hypothetical protein
MQPLTSAIAGTYAALKGLTGQIRLARGGITGKKPMVSTYLAMDFNIFIPYRKFLNEV